MRSLVFLEDELSSAVPELEQGVVAAAAPVAARTDAAFLELACAARRRPTSTSCSTRSGFARAGRHRSKPVSWWRNGDSARRGQRGVEPRSQPPAAPPRSGSSARPVAAVAARARALLWPEVDTTRGAGEAMLPGLTSPSGLHVFVSDTPDTPTTGRATSYRRDDRGRRRRQRPRPRRHLGLAAAAQRGDGLLPDRVRVRARVARGVHGAARPAAQHRAAPCCGRRPHRPQRHRGLAPGAAPARRHPGGAAVRRRRPRRGRAARRAGCR